MRNFVKFAFHTRLLLKLDFIERFRDNGIRFCAGVLLLFIFKAWESLQENATNPVAMAKMFTNRIEIAAYNPSFSYRKTIVKLNDAIKRNDMKTFTVHFYRLGRNLSDDAYNKDKFGVQEGYEAFRKFCPLHLDKKVDTFDEVYQFLVDCKIVSDVHRNFENYDLAVEFSQKGLHMAMSKKFLHQDFEQIFSDMCYILISENKFEIVFEEAKKLEKFIKDSGFSKDNKVYGLALYMQSKYYLKAGENQKSLDLLRKVLKIEKKLPNSSPYYLATCLSEIADCHAMLENFEMALKVLEKVFPITQRWQEFHVKNMRMLQQHCKVMFDYAKYQAVHDPKGAITSFKKFLSFINQNDEFYSNIAIYKEIMVKEQEAKEYLSILQSGGRLRWSSEPPTPEYETGLRLLEEHHFKGALKVFNKIVESGNIQPKFRKMVFEARGDSKIGIEMWAEAIEDFDIALEMAKERKQDMSQCDLYQKIANCYAEMGLNDESLEADGKALSLCPQIIDRSKILTKMAIMMIELEKWERVVEILKQSEKIFEERDKNGMAFLQTYAFYGQGKHDFTKILHQI